MVHVELADGADVALLLACIIFVYWQPVVSSWKRQRKYYDEHRHLIPWAPPGVLYMFLWPAVHICTALAYYFYFSVATSADSYFIAIFVLFVVGMFMNKFWTPFFFELHWLWFALSFYLVMFGCALGSAVLFGIDKNHNYNLSAWLLVPYMLVTAVSGVLNFMWAYRLSPFHLWRDEYYYGDEGYAPSHGMGRESEREMADRM